MCFFRKKRIFINKWGLYPRFNNYFFKKMKKNGK